MITCPFCGTNYQQFQSNCSNCGGPLPLPQVSRPAAPGAVQPRPAQVKPATPQPPAPPEQALPDRKGTEGESPQPVDQLPARALPGRIETAGYPPPPAPPPAPRPIADSYVRTLLLADDNFLGTMAGAFCGMLMLVIAFFKAAGGDTSSRLTTLFLAALLVLAISAMAGGWLFVKARRTVLALRHGAAALAQITKVEQTDPEQPGKQPRWVYHYYFTSKGQRVRGTATTQKPPSPQLKAGQSWWVLYLPETPEQHALYPHL